MDDRALLGEFLRRRREGLSPAEAGLPMRAPGRTPGLRREEVAALATMSTTYCERLERGCGPRPSVPVLSAISVALRLTGDERAHLFRLAGRTVPVGGAAGRADLRSVIAQHGRPRRHRRGRAGQQAPGRLRFEGHEPRWSGSCPRSAADGDSIGPAPS